MLEQILINAKNGNKSLSMTVNPGNAQETMLAMDALDKLYTNAPVPPQSNGHSDNGWALPLLLSYMAFTAVPGAAKETHNCGNVGKCSGKEQNITNSNEQWEQWLRWQREHGGFDTSGYSQTVRQAAPLETCADSSFFAQWNQIVCNAQANGTRPVTGKEENPENAKDDKQSGENNNKK